MRKIDEIIIHCSATEEGKDFTAADINRWHIQRGWKKIGYHYVIRLDGTIEAGRPLDEIGAHCKGHNRNSVGICYIGGLKNKIPCNTMTKEQKEVLLELIQYLLDRFPTIHNVAGHNEYSNKPCPGFNVPQFLSEHKWKYRFGQLTEIPFCKMCIFDGRDNVCCHLCNYDR